MELISVIVPVYNVELYLEQCVDSILSQSYKNIEVILVDDGSTDNSGEICEKYRRDERVTVLHKENGGLSSARNYGMRHAKGEYLSFIDSDDIVGAYFLEELYNAIRSVTAECKISMCRFTRKENSFSSGKSVQELVNSNEILRRILYQMDDELYSVSSCNKLYHRSVFDSVTYPEGRINEDMYVICELLAASKFVSVLDATAYYYRTNPTSITQTGFSPRNMDVVKACDHIIEYAHKKYDDPVLEKAAVNMKFRRCYQMLYKLWLADEKYKEHENVLYSFIKKNKFLILKDPDSRSTSKLTALMAMSGKPLFKLFTKIVFGHKKRKN